MALRPHQIRDIWLQRLTALVQSVQLWAEDLGWSTRQFEVVLQDSQLGKYKAPALLMQESATRILLEPITHSAPGAAGVVDLYLLPAYDDIASLYMNEKGEWHLHYMFPEHKTVATIRDAESKPLTKDSLREALEEMKANAVSQV